MNACCGTSDLLRVVTDCEGIGLGKRRSWSRERRIVVARSVRALVCSLRVHRGFRGPGSLAAEEICLRRLDAQ